MKKYFFLFIFFQVSAFAELTFIDISPLSCNKIAGYGNYEMPAISSFYKVDMSSIRFIRARWGPGRDGSEQCNMVFDTANGPKQCRTFFILTNDGGKTSFGLAVPLYGDYPVCF